MVDQVNNETLFKTVTELAEMEGISKAAISKRLKKLEAAGLKLKRNERGHIVGVPVAHYEALANVTIDPIKVSAARPEAEKQKVGGPPSSVGPLPGSLEHKRLEEKQLDIDRKKRAEALAMGQLVRLDLLRPALERAGKVIQAGINRLENRADDLCLAAEKGSHAARLELKGYSAEICDLVAKELAAIAAEAPEGDPPL
jgi:DNA-binding transcriptional ArsR family regulator